MSATTNGTPASRARPGAIRSTRRSVSAGSTAAGAVVPAHDDLVRRQRREARDAGAPPGDADRGVGGAAPDHRSDRQGRIIGGPVTDADEFPELPGPNWPALAGRGLLWLILAWL